MIRGRFAATESICRIRMQAQPFPDDLAGCLWFVRIWTTEADLDSAGPTSRAKKYHGFLKERPFWNMNEVCQALRDSFPEIAAIEVTDASTGIGIVVYVTWP